MRIDDIAARLSQRALNATVATAPPPTVSPPPTVPSPTVPSLISLPKLPFPFALSSGMPPVSGPPVIPVSRAQPVPDRPTTVAARVTVPTTVPGFLPRPGATVGIHVQPQGRTPPESDSLTSFGNAVSLHCEIPRCKFDRQAQHFHCGFERCIFSSRSSAAISAHLSSFHAFGPIPKHLTYTHADSECPEKACLLSGESHFHCATCKGNFFSGNSQGTHRCNPERQAIKLRLHPQTTLGEIVHLMHDSNRTESNLKSIESNANTIPNSPTIEIDYASFPHNQHSSASTLSPQKVAKACNRPYCKLKKNSVHFHCLVCSQGFTSHERLQSHLRKHQRAELRQAAASGSALSSVDARGSRITRVDPAPFSVVTSPPTIPIPRPTVIRHTTTVIGPLGIHPEMLRLLQRGPGIAGPGIVRGREPANGRPESSVIVREIHEVE